MMFCFFESLFSTEVLRGTFQVRYSGEREDSEYLVSLEYGGSRESLADDRSAASVGVFQTAGSESAGFVFHKI